MPSTNVKGGSVLPKKTFGIALTASIPLILFAFFFLLVTGGLFLAFRDVTDVINLSAGKQLPALTNTAALVRECEWIRGMSFRLEQSDNELLLAERFDALRQRTGKLTETLAQLEASGLYRKEILSLKVKMTAFNGVIPALDQQMTEHASQYGEDVCRCTAKG